jgi:hypothetical protein
MGLMGCVAAGRSTTITPTQPTKIAALTPATPLMLSQGGGEIFAEVATGKNVFSFDARSGDQVTLDIDVTDALWGKEYNDRDSYLYLFDTHGNLLEKNDDADSTTDESTIDGYKIPTDGTYYAVVTTYGNEPVFVGGKLNTWSGNGASRIRYKLILDGVSD